MNVGEMLRSERWVDWTMVEITHCDDAAHYVVVREGRSLKPARWCAAGDAQPGGARVGLEVLRSARP